jgi:AraC family ethanolamine operon transcriptional activator
MNANVEQSQVFQQQFSSFEIFSSVVRGYNLELRQLDRGAFVADLQQIQCAHVFINRFATSRRLEVFGTSPPGLRTFGVPTNRCLPFSWRNQYSTGNTLQLFKSGSGFEMNTQPFFEAIDVSITEDDFNALLQGWELPELDEIINNGEMTSCHPVKLQQLRARLHSVCAILDSNPDVLMGSSVLQNIIRYEVPWLLAQALLSADGRQAQSTPEKRSHALKTALEYIVATSKRSGSFATFCRESGINPRTLQRAFLEQYGVSPKAYAQAFHLNNVYKTLIRSHPKSTRIAEVARRSGFSHMSQFARDYRRHFGELPSATLKAR